MNPAEAVTLSVAMITVDSTDPLPLAAWWATQVGGRIVEENDGWFVVVAAPSGPALGFQKVDQPTAGKNRMHLDLVSADRESTVGSLVAAGAVLVAEHELDGFAWTTLADPDGNQFCVSGRHGDAA
jgi:hypothetical protein